MPFLLFPLSLIAHWIFSNFSVISFFVQKLSNISHFCIPRILIFSKPAAHITHNVTEWHVLSDYMLSCITKAVALPMTCKHTLMCKISGAALYAETALPPQHRSVNGWRVRSAACLSVWHSGHFYVRLQHYWLFSYVCWAFFYFIYFFFF